MKKNILKKIMRGATGIFFAVLSSTTLADAHHPVHGFVVLGDNPPRLYHLARFNSPHRYQGLFEVALKNSAGEKLDLGGLRSQWPKNTVISLASKDHFDLPELAEAGRPFSFDATLFAGYLRGENKTVIQETVRVERLSTNYFREILPGDPPRKNPTYILACEPGTGEFFAAHVVSGQPGFEEILKISALYSGSPEEAPSETFPCTPDISGSQLHVYSPTGDRPLDDQYGRYGHADALGFTVGLAGVERLLLDEKSVN